MSSYRGHLVGGAVTFLLVQQGTQFFVKAPPSTMGGTSPKGLIFGLTFCLLGSLFPDIDTKSVGQRIFYMMLTCIIVATIAMERWNLLSVLSLLGLFPLLVHHRGIIHTVWFVTLAPLPIPLIIMYNAPKLFLQGDLIYAYLYFVSGALSHLLLDYGIWKSLKRAFSRK